MQLGVDMGTWAYHVSEVAEDVSCMENFVRRTFLPVGEEKEDEVLERGYLSLSDSDEDGLGLKHAFAERIFDAFDVEENTNECVDFGDGLEGLSDPFADVDMTEVSNQASVDFE